MEVKWMGVTRLFHHQKLCKVNFVQNEKKIKKN